MNGTDVNTEELMQLAPDVVFYSASNPALGEKLTASGFCAIAVSANKWQYNCIETLNNWIDLLSQIFSRRMTGRRSAGPTVRTSTPWCKSASRISRMTSAHVPSSLPV